MSSPSDIRRIEELVRKRDTKSAKLEIRRYLRARPGNEDAQIQACDWLRRLGLFKDSFRVLDIESALPGYPRGRQQGGKLGRRFLWAARILNLLGASAFAKELLNQAVPTNSVEFRVAGNICLSNFEYGPALRFFQKMKETAENPGDYDTRLGILGLADSLAGLSRFAEAEQVANEMLTASPEPLLQAISLQAMGEYSVRSGEHERGIPFLERALSLMPAEDETPDMGFLLKWYGYALARTGRRRAGLSLLTKAFRLLHRPGRREETWLEVLRLRCELGDLSQGERISLSAYPGVTEKFRIAVGQESAGRLGYASASLTIWPASDEFSFTEINSTGNCLGIPKEVELAAYLRSSGSWGIGKTRLKSLLWPQEPQSFFQLEDRLHKLLRRLRRSYRISVGVKKSMLRLEGAEERKVSVWTGRSPALPRFLRDRASFRGEELERFYSVSRAQRFKILKSWVDQGWIAREGRGPNITYRVV